MTFTQWLYITRLLMAQRKAQHAGTRLPGALTAKPREGSAGT